MNHFDTMAAVLAGLMLASCTAGVSSDLDAECASFGATLDACEIDAPDLGAFCAAHSDDGVNWSAQIDLIPMTFPNEGAMFSPSVWRVSPGDWRAWFIAQTGNSAMWSAPGPLGPWGNKTPITFGGTHRLSARWRIFTGT